MKKTAFKTFVCSFVFSLFILFTINGLFFYTPRTPSQKLKIPAKNISLFFAASPRTAYSAQVKPIKKIALHQPLQRKPTSLETVYAPSELSLPSVEPKRETKKTKPAVDDIQIIDNIPLEVASKEIIPPKELVSANFESIMNTPPTVYQPKEPLQKVDNTPPKKDKSQDPSLLPMVLKEESTQSSAEEQQHTPTPLIVANAHIKKSSLSAVVDDETDIPSSKDKSLQDGNGYTLPAGDKQQLLIPLQKDINTPNEPTFAVAKAADSDQLAMVSDSAPLGSMTPENIPSHATNSDKNKRVWENMKEKDTPWVAAKGTKFPKNNTVLEADYYKEANKNKLEASSAVTNDGVKLAAEMVQNILIPIPEDILKEDPLIPQLESSPDDKKNDKNSEQTENTKTQQVVSEKDKLVTKDVKENKPSLLKSITSLFSGSNNTAEDNFSESDKNSDEKPIISEQTNSFVDRITGRIRKSSDNKPIKILPAEMRLAFQPNRAEISGITLKWLQAFANKVNSDRSVILEIRIDGTSSYALQQKRLNLLHNILTNKGVDYRKINTVFTTREPNSFIIRTVRINSNIDRDKNRMSDQAAYYRAW